MPVLTTVHKPLPLYRFNPTRVRLKRVDRVIDAVDILQLQPHEGSSETGFSTRYRGVILWKPTRKMPRKAYATSPLNTGWKS
jgi:hypothetical protein